MSPVRNTRKPLQPPAAGISNGVRKFADRVRDIVKKIPKGKTLSYGEVAALAGSPGAARAVGTIMKGNMDPDVPCHRVIKADGTLGGYNRGTALKERRLKKEGAL